MSQIQTSEVTRRLSRSLGLKETQGFGLVEAVQPVVIVGSTDRPGQRDLYDVAVFAEAGTAVAAASAYQWLVQNNGADWLEVLDLDVRNGTPDTRGLVVGLVFSEPAVAWFPTTCPELSQATTVGTTGFTRVRETVGISPLATVNQNVYATDIAPGERFRLSWPVPVPPFSTLSVFVGTGPGTGSLLFNLRASLPLQAA